MIKRFKDFYINENTVFEQHLKQTENLLRNLGHYKDDDGYWHIGEGLELDTFCVYNGKLVVKFKEVRGTLNAASLGLTSLEGFPERVGGTLNLSHNKLTSLEGCPKYAKRFVISGNEKLTSLNGASQEVESVGLLSNTSIPALERTFYEHYACKKYDNYFLELLTYICKLYKDSFSFEEVLKTIHWPEGFLNNNLINSVSGISKFNLFESVKLNDIKERIWNNTVNLKNKINYSETISRSQHWNAYDIWTFKNLYTVLKIDNIIQIKDRYNKDIISKEEILYLDKCLQKYLEFIELNPKFGLPKGIRNALSGSLEHERTLLDSFKIYKNVKWTNFSPEFIDTLSSEEKIFLNSKKSINKYNL